MKVLATFDGSEFAEAVLPTLARVAQLPDAEVTFLAVEHEPHGKLASGTVQRGVIATADPMRGGPFEVITPPDTQYAETKEQALERRVNERIDYMAGLRKALPPAAKCYYEVILAHHPAQAIIDWAKEHQPDVIVMATHGRAGLAHAVFGSTAEAVVRSGVAPVLLVRPKGAA
jgi:nucleotide-binding universal stress UspA family protein